MTFDQQLWSFDRDANFTERQHELIARRGRRAVHQALGQPARSRALLSGARDVRRGQGRARRRHRRRPADRGQPERAGAARGRQHHARPCRCRRSRTSPIRWSATRTTRSCGARSPMRGRATGRRRATLSANVDGALGTLPLELQRIALKDAAARRDRGRRLRRRRRHGSTISRRSACRASSSRRSRC